MKQCPKCCVTVSTGATICARCGAPLPLLVAYPKASGAELAEILRVRIEARRALARELRELRELRAVLAHAVDVAVRGEP